MLITQQSGSRVMIRDSVCVFSSGCSSTRAYLVPQMYIVFGFPGMGSPATAGVIICTTTFVMRCSAACTVQQLAANVTKTPNEKSRNRQLDTIEARKIRRSVGVMRRPSNSEARPFKRKGVRGIHDHEAMLPSAISLKH